MQLQTSLMQFGFHRSKKQSSAQLFEIVNWWPLDYLQKVSLMADALPCQDTPMFYPIDQIAC